MKHSDDYERFTSLVDHLMRIPREEMLRREAEYRKEADANPNKPGPVRGTKRKRKAATPPSASDL